MAAHQPPPSSRRHTGQPETMLGPYKKLGQIGKGSFAIVYKGTHPDNNHLLAIKTVQHAQLKGKLKANLLSEIEILKKIHHPHIVGLINILESTNHVHLIMEFCQLGDLATFVKKRSTLDAHPVTAEMIRHYPNPQGGGFNEVIVRHFAKQLASALEFLRSKNLVHRDLKPQNLLLNPPAAWIAQEPPENRPFEVVRNSLIPAVGIPSLPTLKIADFGFARHLPTTTMAETLCGSPLYMAPEILRYERYDAKADLWSVGTVLYELVIGRPPFRAANHVDLLRKIEKTMDKIKFVDEVEISENMKSVIRGLLKKMPTERMSWENFFQSAIITDDIPGLVEADKHLKHPQKLEDARNTSSAAIKEKAKLRDDEFPMLEDDRSSRPDSRKSYDRQADPALDEAELSPRTSDKMQRPSLKSHATAPASQGIKREAIAAATSMERRKSQNPPSPSTSAPRDPPERERASQRTQDRASREAKDRAVQDVAFERDYVVVEKRQVEVNAFADELAASPQIHGGQKGLPMQAGAMQRRTTSQGTPTSTTGAQPSQNRNMQVAVRPDTTHQRKQSYERRYGPNKNSATSAIAAALNMVNFRLYGQPSTPMNIGKGPSPPQGYGAFPTYPLAPTTPLLLNDSGKPTDEDQGTLFTIEECATRSDVVYGFAEVKYKQLIPATPSNKSAIGMRRPESAGGTTEDEDDGDGLTANAIIGISEEALVLYVKALAILNNTINLAGHWWSQKNRGEVIGEVSTSPRSLDATKQNTAAVGMRINHVVQWARDRFNECLTKSEVVSARLVQAQRKSPSYQSSSSTTPTPHDDTSKDSQISNISLTSGITAEKLMYDRALEMSRSAAVNELVGEDLPGCEVSYATAIRLLEAVLEREDDQSKKKPSKKSQEKENKQDDAIEGIEEGDRQTVLRMIERTSTRLTALRKKMAAQNLARRNSKSQPTTPENVGTPSSTPVPPTISRTPPR